MSFSVYILWNVVMLWLWRVKFSLVRGNSLLRRLMSDTGVNFSLVQGNSLLRRLMSDTELVNCDDLIIIEDSEKKGAPVKNSTRKPHASHVNEEGK